jgi:hypothetical protein
VQNDPAGANLAGCLAVDVKLQRENPQKSAPFVVLSLTGAKPHLYGHSALISDSFPLISDTCINRETQRE